MSKKNEFKELEGVISLVGIAVLFNLLFTWIIFIGGIGEGIREYQAEQIVGYTRDAALTGAKQTDLYETSFTVKRTEAMLEEVMRYMREKEKYGWCQ